VDTLQFADHSEKDAITHFFYSSADKGVNLTVEYFPCQSDLCKTVFANALKYTNGQANNGAGQFGVVNDSEYHADPYSYSNGAERLNEKLSSSPGRQKRRSTSSAKKKAER
jgi:hypothetical protein